MYLQKVKKIHTLNEMNILETEGLSKRYGDTLAVDNVSIHVSEGEIYGFLGLNGAGKSTTIRLLLRLVRPNRGICRLFGKEPKQASDIWNDIGYLIETPYAYPDLSVVENLKVTFKLRGLRDKSQIDRMIDQLGLGLYRNTKAKNLSSGNNQRLGLAKALIHQPKLLVLDEPINGLDPAGIVEIRMLLKHLAENHGTTIFLSSHILSEIAKLTTRIGIIHYGALVKEIKSIDFQNKIIRKLCIDSIDNEKVVNLLQEKGYDAKISHDRIEIEQQQAIAHPEDIAIMLVDHQLPPKMISVFEEDLESYFLRVINDTSS